MQNCIHRQLNQKICCILLSCLQENFSLWYKYYKFFLPSLSYHIFQRFSFQDTHFVISQFASSPQKPLQSFSDDGNLRNSHGLILFNYFSLTAEIWTFSSTTHKNERKQIFVLYVSAHTWHCFSKCSTNSWMTDDDFILCIGCYFVQCISALKTNEHGRTCELTSAAIICLFLLSYFLNFLR